MHFYTSGCLYSFSSICVPLLARNILLLFLDRNILFSNFLKLNVFYIICTCDKYFSSLTFNVTRMQSVKDHTLYTARRPGWTVSITLSNRHLVIRQLIQFPHLFAALAATNTLFCWIFLRSFYMAVFEKVKRIKIIIFNKNHAVKYLQSPVVFSIVC